MIDCIFCKIVKGEIPSFKIYEDDSYLAILDIAQFTEGHTIVIPKNHFRFIWDINDNKYFEVINKIANHYKKLGYDYVDSATFGRMVPHAHFHLIPHNGEMNDWRNSLEKIGEMQIDPSRRITKNVGEEIAKKLKLP